MLECFLVKNFQQTKYERPRDKLDTYCCKLKVVQTVVVENEPPPFPIFYSSSCKEFVK